MTMDGAIETTQADTHSRIMEEFIHQLNQESEADKGLLEPVPIENLDWMRFGLCSSLPARAVTHTRRLLAQLQPKSLRQQVYMTCEVIAEDDCMAMVMPAPRKKLSAGSALQRRPQSSPAAA